MENGGTMMTTASRPHNATLRPRWTDDEAKAEKRRNKGTWSRQKSELRKQFPHHWIVIYAGDTVEGFEDGQSLIQHMNTLDDFTRGCSYWLPPPAERRSRFITNARRAV